MSPSFNSKPIRKAVLFDFDGTLVDTKELLWEEFPKATAELDIGQIRTRNEFFGLYNTNFYRSLAQTNIPEQKMKGLIKNFRERVAQRSAEMHLFRGIQQALRRIKKEANKTNTVLIIVSSNFSQTIQNVLAQCRIGGIFDFISGPEKERSKEKRIKEFMQQHGLKGGGIHDVLYIGDTAGDVLESHQICIDVCAVTWGFHSAAQLEKSKPTFLAKNSAELERVIDKFVHQQKKISE